MLTILLLLGVFTLALIVLAVVAVGLIYFIQSDRRDRASTARQDWINQRGENDEPEG